MNCSAKRHIAIFVAIIIAITLMVVTIAKIDVFMQVVTEFRNECVKVQDLNNALDELEFEPVVEVECVVPTPEPTPEPTPVPTPEPVIKVYPVIDCPLDAEIQQMIWEKCELYDIDFAFAMAVIYKESTFDPNADSGSSVGLMQINRCNHERLSEELGLTDFFDPEQNVTAGLYMLRELFDKYEDEHKVLMAYNKGESGARKLWNDEIYSTSYSRKILRKADEYRNEIERMGENDSL